MARPTEFDRHRARDKALVLFWRKGYQASSLTDLLEAMEIGRSSFYAAFTDKRSLYMECLDMFAQRTQDMVYQARAKQSPLNALQFFLEQTFSDPRAIRAEWGCLLVNTVLEMSGVDDALADQASRHLETMQQIFQTCLEDAGFTASVASEMAALLMVVNEGVRVSSRRRLTQQQQLAPIATTFRLLRNASVTPPTPTLESAPESTKGALA